MAKTVTLSLKVPTRPPTLLHILENSFLEGLVDYKPLDPGVDLRTIRSKDIASAYQVKADVSVIEDELQLQFVAKNTGLHVARIFANTKEVCHAVSFNVTPTGEVLTLDAPSPKQGGFEGVDARRSKYGSTQSAVTTVANSAASTVRAVESDHRLSQSSPSPKPHVTFPVGHNTQNVFEKLLHSRKETSTVLPRKFVSLRPASTAFAFGSNGKLQFPRKFGRNIKAR